MLYTIIHGNNLNYLSILQYQTPELQKQLHANIGGIYTYRLGLALERDDFQANNRKMKSKKNSSVKDFISYLIFNWKVTRLLELRGMKVSINDMNSPTTST